jgi:aspartate kinase
MLLHTKKLQNWVFFCNTFTYINLIPISKLSSIAYFGAEVLHPISMQPAIRTKVPVRVKNSYNPKAPGTTITYTRDKSNSAVCIIRF